MNSSMREVSQVEPRPTVVVTRSVPVGWPRESTSWPRTFSSFSVMSRVGAHQELALLGRNQAAGVAVEEGRSELLLERAHLPADRGLAHVERLAGPRERARLRGGVKDPQLVPVHLPLLGPVATGRPKFSAYSAASRALSNSSRTGTFSASSAAMQPSPAAVTAWRNTSSVTSPAA